MIQSPCMLVDLRLRFLRSDELGDVLDLLLGKHAKGSEMFV